MNGAVSVRRTELKGKALCILETEELLFYRKGKLFLHSFQEKRTWEGISLPLPVIKKYLVKMRLLERLLHIEVRWAMQLATDEVLFQFEKGIYLLHLQTGEIEKQRLEIRGKPLQIGRIKGVNGFLDSCVLGDYGMNTRRDPVNIYQKADASKDWKIVYSFPAGKVRHIHGFFQDDFRNCVYILTGDENQESGIWKATENFKFIEPIAYGEQCCRACQMLITKDTLYFMNDSPSDKNYVNRLTDAGIRKLERIRGTCIYGIQTPVGGIYSTICEPDAHIDNRIKYWFTNRPGAGIQGREIEVFYLSESGKKTNLINFTHDGFPLHLFQYAAVCFTNFINQKVYFSPLCVKKYDMEIFEVQLINEKSVSNDDRVLTESQNS